MIEYIYFFFRDFLQFNKKIAQFVWHPVFKFENLLDYKEIKGYGGTVTSSFWFRGDQSHTLDYGEEFQLSVSCHFHFNKFPFDFHECPIYFGTDVYSTDQMKFDELKSKFYKKRGATFFYDVTRKLGPLDFTQYRSKSSSF